MKVAFTKTRVEFEGTGYKFSREMVEEIKYFVKICKPSAEKLAEVLFKESKSIDDVVSANAEIITY